jgi:sugar lactone lactonase YvrE
VSARLARPAAALALAAAVAVALALPAAAPTAAPRPACAPWKLRTLASGQGWLENLAFDGRGGITVSALSQNRLLRVSRRLRVTTLLDGVNTPGAQVRVGRYLFFNTGDSVSPDPVGTIDRLNLKTGRRITWARGLIAPNGLALLPNGDAVVSRTSGPGLTRVRARDRAHPQFDWVTLQSTNGLALTPSRRALYVARTLSPDGEIDRVRIAAPHRVRPVAHLGAGVLPDDLTVGADGSLYVAGFGSGSIYRVNPATGRFCAIASGLSQPTSARFGGPGWNPRRLYVTDAGGHLSELRRP